MRIFLVWCLPCGNHLCRRSWICTAHVTESRIGNPQLTTHTTRHDAASQSSFRLELGNGRSGLIPGRRTETDVPTLDVSRTTIHHTPTGNKPHNKVDNEHMRRGNHPVAICSWSATPNKRFPLMCVPVLVLCSCKWSRRLLRYVQDWHQSRSSVFMSRRVKTLS